MSTEDDRAPVEETVPDAEPREPEPDAVPEPVEPASAPEPETVPEAPEPEMPEPDAPEPQTAEPETAEAGSVLETGAADGSDDEGLVAVDSGLPDIEDDERLEAALEALLLVVDSPIGEDALSETLGQPVARVTVALRTMAQKFTERASGIDLRRVGEGWRFYTRDTYAPFVEKLLLDGQRSKLTRAALESLAVIAYRQPVTRARVAAVRGVNVDGVIRTLLARGLIEEMGTDPETTGTLYVTTELFLERLGLSSLNDLPPIAPLLPEVDTIDDI
ncbi:SMC-Scp complex subunit ScpB [Amycolatopsis benzoatilytica]|uniref:SMC-Scp complex subunit ScpB n=1 Tax=Amycolatopsis benzoatilytica TaxID=346045 RepID=UPI0003705F87|nr:SMC-Scp complex subunit ScpB [Amycolatopsis benzoatilytica]